jgi:aminoglycoside phosphotransferase (APT) family kinase protein
VTASSAGSDVVRSWKEVGDGAREPLIVLRSLEALLDRAGLGSGPVVAIPLGDGHSNVTYAIDRSDQHLVLRRPPRGPLPASAHDVIREARILTVLSTAGLAVPAPILMCEDASVIGAPFYLTPFIDGYVLGADLPMQWQSETSAALIARELVDGLVRLHAIDLEASGLSAFGRGSGYLERQVRRFRGLLAEGASRRIPELEELGDWLDANRPATSETAFVHGDYRLGNLMFSRLQSPRLAAILDWEMATVGDPLADLGYLTATWAQEGDPSDAMLDLSVVTRRPGFPTRGELVAAYAQQSGRQTRSIVWYQVLALWKSAIFLEGSYRRFTNGSTEDPYFERLGTGVPKLAQRAWSLANGRL